VAGRWRPEEAALGGWWRPEEAARPVMSRAVGLRPRQHNGGSRGGSVGGSQGGGGPRRPGGGGRGGRDTGVEVGVVEAGAVEEPGCLFCIWIFTCVMNISCCLFLLGIDWNILQ
jgi:hypothetical protein